MACSVCGKDNPPGQQCCGSCGAATDAASDRLRQQVIAIVKTNFTDQKLAVFEIADDVEQRVAKRSRRGTAGLVLAGLLLGGFGIKSVSDAKGKLDEAAQAAANQLDGTAKHDAALLDQRTKLKVQEIEGLANNVEQALRQIKVRESGTNRQLSIAEASIKEYRVRFDALNKVREQSPTTQIGDLQSSLFTPIAAPSTIAQFFEGPPFGAPYQVGATGTVIQHLQAKLIELGCAKSFPATGEFGVETANAVMNFKRTENGLINSNQALGLRDDETGEVSGNTWSNLFSTLAPHCN